MNKEWDLRREDYVRFRTDLMNPDSIIEIYVTSNIQVCPTFESMYSISIPINILVLSSSAEPFK